MQKDKGWMAASIFIKLRGLCVKNRASLLLLLNERGPRLDFKETRGLFSKKASEPVFWIESGTSVADRTAQSHPAREGGGSVCCGVASGLPESALSGVPELSSGCGLAMGGVRDTRNPTGHSWRWIRAWSEPTTRRGGAGF